MTKNIPAKWILFFLIVVSAVVNVYFRLNSLRLDFLDDSSKEAVYSNISAELKKGITQTYTTIPQATADRLLDVVLKEYVKKNKPEITEKINKEIKQLKEDFQDKNGLTYLLEEDPYRWTRRVENFLNTGHFGTRLLNGKDWDGLRSVPFGTEVEPLKFHYYAGAYFYKLLHLFNNKISLMNALGFYPVFFSLVMVLAIFFFCTTFKMSSQSAFIASLAIGLSRVLLERSGFGWFDTDIYNIIFPLLIISILARALNNENKKKYIYLVSSAFLVGVYSSFWSVWWLVFLVIIFGLFLYKLEFVIYDERYGLSHKLKESFVVLGVFIISSYLFVLLTSGPGAVIKSVTEPLSYLKLRNSLIVGNFWPDIAFSVHELNKAGPEDIIKACGGVFVVYGGIVGLLLLLIRRRRAAGLDSRRFLLFVLFGELVSAVLLSSFGLRFLVFLITPLGISFAVFWDLLREFFVSYKKTISISRLKLKISSIVLCCLFIIMIFPPLSAASKVQILPLMNRTWFAMFEKIKQLTPENAVINTDWDYGDFVMTISKRATVYDGSWQYTAVSYWMPRAFNSQNEEEAAGIFRMVDSGGNSAFEEIDKIVSDKMLALELINKMILMKEDQARVLLGKYIDNKEKVEEILKFMYGKPPESYVLLLDRMSFTYPIGSTVASWDFKRSQAWSAFNRMNKKDSLSYLVKNLGYTPKEAKETYLEMSLMDKKDAFSWVAPKSQRFYVFDSRKIKEDDSVVIFDSGIIFDKKSFKTYFKNDVTKQMIIPGRLLVFDGAAKEYTNKNGDANYAVFLLKEKEEYKAFMADSQLLDSLFFKLYCLKASGLKFFKLINSQEKDNGTNAYLYKINWQGI